MWLDLRNLSEHAPRSDTDELGAAIDSMRNYYSQNVVGESSSPRRRQRSVHNYRDVPGGIPIPATMSIELGAAITGQGRNIGYRVASQQAAEERNLQAIGFGSLIGKRISPRLRL